MHPLFLLLATRPQLLADHAEAYAELVAVEVNRMSATWMRLALLNAMALCSLSVAVALAGVALMLWAVMPALPAQAPWVLIVLPLLPLAAAVGCLLATQRDGQREAFDNLRQQFKADVLMLREVATA
jgi:uncharacterized membrane protein YqjE